MSLARVTLTPIASAAISSSLTASKARPMRDERSRARKITSSARKP